MNSLNDKASLRYSSKNNKKKKGNVLNSVLRNNTRHIYSLLIKAKKALFQNNLPSPYHRDHLSNPISEIQAGYNKTITSCVLSAYLQNGGSWEILSDCEANEIHVEFGSPRGCWMTNNLHHFCMPPIAIPKKPAFLALTFPGTSRKDRP